MARSPKRLVIDTDIARATGSEDAPAGRSKNCREFLYAILDDSAHTLVMTDAIRKEWDGHQSRHTKRWYAVMLKRNRVCWIEAPPDEELRHSVELVAPNEYRRQAMLKDVHLVEAACKADKIVLSMDEKVRKCFHEAALDIGILKLIVWMNPSREEEMPLTWLRDGAEAQRERMLGYYEENSI